MPTSSKQTSKIQVKVRFATRFPNNVTVGVFQISGGRGSRTLLV